MMNLTLGDENMKISKLIIEHSEKNLTLFPRKTVYDFGENTLITSHAGNTQGKTTLIRFILYALGYKIPQTDGMKIYEYKTNLEVLHDNKKYSLIRDGQKQYITDGNNTTQLVQANDLGESIPMLSIVLGIKNEYISSSLLGCFYIDQEKGWTLLNRGIVIGKIRFNIEQFLINIENKVEFENYFLENRTLENGIERANFLLKVMKENYIYNETPEENRKEIINTIKNLEKEKNILSQKIYSKKRELDILKDILFQNENFAKKIEDMNIIINYNGKDIVVNKENLKSYDYNNDILEMKRNEIELEIVYLEKENNKIKTEIRKIRKDNEETDSNNELSKLFSKLKNNDFSAEELELLKDSNRRKIKENNKIINEEIKKTIDEFWEILLPILNDLEIGKEYKDKKIILTNDMAGKSGTQMHQLSLAYKIALTKLVEVKFGIKLPFIIDSPRASEMKEEVATLMLEITKKYLPNNQLIVSSVFFDFETNFQFDKKIFLEDGVVKELEKFI